MSDWLHTCDEFGGPSYPNLEQCINENTGCGAFKEGFCTYDDNYVITNFENLLDAQQCQSFCTEVPGCVWFYHDRQYCTLYFQKVGQCGAISGPVLPSMDAC